MRSPAALRTYESLKGAVRKYEQDFTTRPDAGLSDLGRSNFVRKLAFSESGGDRLAETRDCVEPDDGRKADP
jgi:hypothetical protein